MRQAEGSFLLFVDHVHRLVGADDGIDTANLLVPVLARRQRALIGVCSLEQYRQYIERDAAFKKSSRRKPDGNTGLRESRSTSHDGKP